MQPTRRLVLGSLLAAGVSPAFAQAWPARPIKMILPFGPGSATDVLARTISEPLSRALKQPIVLEHKAGANTSIATGLVAKGTPDGYTLGLLTNSGLVANPGGMMDNLPYDVNKEIALIAQVAAVNYVLAVHPSITGKTLREVVDHVKANPGKLSYGSGNTGGISFGGHFAKSNGLTIAHVPYKSVPPALVDLAAGHVQVMFPDTGSAMAMIQAGKIRPIAVPTAKRHPLLPDVPTYAESGFPTPPDFSGWWMLTAPAGTPNEILDRLNAELTPILKQPDVVAALLRAGVIAAPSTRDEAVRYQRDQLALWTKMIAETGLKIQ
jgi:tripartite-type tricarboxylate transporter receptor subunit TctC